MSSYSYIFFVVPLVSVLLAVLRRSAMYSPVPLLAFLALLSAALGLVPSTQHAQQVMTALLIATLGGSILHLQLLASSSRFSVILPAIVLICGTLVSFLPIDTLVAPVLLLVFALSTLPSTGFFIISAAATTLTPPSAAPSATSFPSSEFEKPRQTIQPQPIDILFPPHVTLTKEYTKSSWFSSHSDPESLFTSLSTRASYFCFYSPRQRSRSFTGTAILISLLATQISLILSFTFQLCSITLFSIESKRVFVFHILQTSFIVLSLLFILIAYYYQHHPYTTPSRFSLTSSLKLGLKTSISPSKPAHTRSPPSSSSSFFSPKPKRTPLPLSLDLNALNYNGRADVVVISSEVATDDDAVSPLNPSSTCSSPSLASQSFPSPIAIPAEVNLSPSPARTPTFIYPPSVPSSPSACGAASTRSCSRSLSADYDCIYDSDMDMLNDMYGFADLDFTDLRDPFAPPPPPSSRASTPRACSPVHSKTHARTPTRMSAWGRLPLCMPKSAPRGVCHALSARATPADSAPGRDRDTMEDNVLLAERLLVQLASGHSPVSGKILGEQHGDGDGALK